MQKNVSSQKFIVFAFDSTTNLPKTGDAANITAYIAKDFGSVTVLGDTSATEMDATNAKGYYLFDATQAESNADIILVSGKSSTANIVVIGAPSALFTTPASFTSSVAQTGDSYARLGAPAGASIAADLVEIEAETDGIAAISTATPLTAAQIATGVWQDATAGDFTVGGTIGKSIMQGVALGTGIKVDVDTIKTNPVVNGGTFTFPTNATGASTTNITAGTITTVTNLTNAPTAGDFTATMKTSAQTAADAAITANALVLEIEADTDTLTAGVTVTTNNDKTGYSLAAGGLTGTAYVPPTTALTESYSALHAAPTIAQLLFEIRSLLQEKAVATTTLTAKKVDGSTTAMTFTLNDATSPTSITRAS